MIYMGRAFRLAFCGLLLKYVMFRPSRLGIPLGGGRICSREEFSFAFVMRCMGQAHLWGWNREVFVVGMVLRRHGI